MDPSWDMMPLSNPSINKSQNLSWWIHKLKDWNDQVTTSGFVKSISSDYTGIMMISSRIYMEIIDS